MFSKGFHFIKSEQKDSGKCRGQAHKHKHVAHIHQRPLHWYKAWQVFVSALNALIKLRAGAHKRFSAQKNKRVLFLLQSQTAELYLALTCHRCLPHLSVLQASHKGGKNNNPRLCPVIFWWHPLMMRVLACVFSEVGCEIIGIGHFSLHSIDLIEG